MIISLIIGLIIGAIASKLMKQHHGIIMNIIIGIAGGALGNWLTGTLGVTAPWAQTYLMPIVGACLIIWIFSKIF